MRHYFYNSAKIQHLLHSILASITLLCASSVCAEVRLPAVFNDGMVLQQQTDAALWGTATPLAKVKITPSWSKKTTVIKSDSEGKWSTSIETPVAGGPFTVKLDDGSTKTISDVYIGEVWLCSGQSNMVYGINGSLKKGEKVGETFLPLLRVFVVEKNLSLNPVEDVKAKWTKSAPETIKEYGAIPFYFGRELHKHLNVPIGILYTAYGGTPQEAWISEENLKGIQSVEDSLKKAHQQNTTGVIKSNKTPTATYNAMIAPLIPYTIKGVCWYQGEANIVNPADYPMLLDRFIDSWRAAWNMSDMPFVIAQLAGYNPANIYKRPWNAVQKAQVDAGNNKAKVATVLNYDIGEVRNIHPKNKQESARRFALAARALAYNENVLARGASVESVVFDGAKAILTFKDCGKGLKMVAGDTLTGFNIAGEDQKYYMAKAAIISPNQVEVHSTQVQQPRFVSYATRSFNEGINLYNEAMLPAVPFNNLTSDNK